MFFAVTDAGPEHIPGIKYKRIDLIVERGSDDNKYRENFMHVQSRFELSTPRLGFKFSSHCIN